jgi:hypothetical protein
VARGLTEWHDVLGPEVISQRLMMMMMMMMMMMVVVVVVTDVCLCCFCPYQELVVARGLIKKDLEALEVEKEKARAARRRRFEHRRVGTRRDHRHYSRRQHIASLSSSSSLHTNISSSARLGDGDAAV